MGMTYACMFVGEHKRPLLQGWNVGLVKVVCCPSHRPCRLRFQMLGVQWVLVRCRDHTLSFQGCGGGVPFQFWILHGEGGGFTVSYVCSENVYPFAQKCKWHINLL